VAVAALGNSDMSERRIDSLCPLLVRLCFCKWNPYHT